MNKKYCTGLVLTAILLIFSSPLQSEKVSLKFSFKTNSVGESDVHTWINSYNTLWKDYQTSKGGSISGQFELPHFGANYEIELRIPIVSGFALNLAGSPLSSQKEGTIDYQNLEGTQNESHFIQNEITALPIKIGFSFSYPLPILPNLSVFAGAGRQIVFIKYKTQENYDAVFSVLGQEFSYWFKNEGTYRSEALGFYASLGAEYEVMKFFSLVIETEKTWAKADGFKGAWSYKDYTGIDKSKKATLYFYEKRTLGFDQYYSVLAGQEKRPEDSTIRNIRQGEFNMNNFSLKIGIRVKF